MTLTETQKDRLITKLFSTPEGVLALAILEKDFHLKDRVWSAGRDGDYPETPAQIVEGMRWAYLRIEERIKRGYKLMATTADEADDAAKTEPKVSKP